MRSVDHPFTDCVNVFALKREDVCQEGFNSLVHHFPATLAARRSGTDYSL
jgi:hypothetical protein